MKFLCLFFHIITSVVVAVDVVAALHVVVAVVFVDVVVVDVSKNKTIYFSACFCCSPIFLLCFKNTQMSLAHNGMRGKRNLKLDVATGFPFSCYCCRLE